jgi:succinate dehydrogenase/fumarate reductase flavoprotein subunit
MTAHVGIMRSKQSLTTAMEQFQALRADVERMAASGPIHFNPGWNTIFDVQSLIVLAESVIQGAIAREESRGAQWRVDFPEELADLGRVNFVQRRSPGEGLSIEARPIPAMPESLARLFRASAAPGVLRAREEQRHLAKEE